MTDQQETGKDGQVLHPTRGWIYPDWTREHPTEPGWYWIIADPDEPEVECVYLQENGYFLVTAMPEAVKPEKEHKTLWWPVPAEPPRLTKE